MLYPSTQEVLHMHWMPQKDACEDDIRVPQLRENFVHKLFDVDMDTLS